MTRWRRLASVLLFVGVGIVLSSLTATAARVPMLLGYGGTVGPSLTMRVAAVISVRTEGGSVAEYDYGDAHNGYAGSANAGEAGGAGAGNACDDDLEHPHGEVRPEAVIYHAPAIASATKGGGGGSATTGSGGPQKGVGVSGWRGDSQWKGNVKALGQGGTYESLNGTISTEAEATDLINEGGGRVVRVDPPHEPRNSHDFPHINYTTANGLKGMVRIIPLGTP